MSHKAFVEKTVLERLQALGWTASDGAAIATRSYPTIVGAKEAQAYLQDFGSDSQTYHLTGVYWSEGRNSLEPHFVAIPKTATREEVASLVMQFGQKTDAVVSETYAARLIAKDSRMVALGALADDLVGQLRSRTDSKRDTFEIPSVLSMVFERLSKNERDLDSFALGQVVDYWVGRRVQATVEDCLALHAQLVRRGHDQAHKYDFGYADRYAFWAADRVGQIDADLQAVLERACGESQGPADPDVYRLESKAFVLMAQSYSYFVLLQKRFGNWSIHVRRIYGQPGTGTRARPNLEMFTAGSLEVGEASAGEGLRYGDLRDAGYLVSVKDSFGQPCADAAIKCDFGLLSVVMYDLNSAIDTLVKGAE